MARKYKRGGGSGSEILVVDDSPEILESTRRLLAKEGHEVHTAPDGSAALEFLADNRVQVLVVDYFMPGMTGEETFLAIRELDPTARVVLCSGYTEQEAVARFAGGGLAGFLQKPFRPEDLLAAIRGARPPSPSA